MSNRSTKSRSRKGNIKRGNAANSKRVTNNNRSIGGDDICDRDGVSKDKSNDPAWYAANPEMLVAAASVSYNVPLGTAINPGEASINPNNDHIAPFGIPGILRLDVVPTPGIATDKNAPVNIAARNVYSFVRHANSGASNYNSPDLMVYLLSIDSLYGYHAFLTRLYGVLMTYSQTNRYYPKYLVQAMGCDFDDLIANGAALNYYINNLGQKISSLVYPANMTFTTRHAWMYSNVYVDGMTSKAQTYIYVPYGFYKFNPTKYNTGGCCEFVKWRSGLNKTLSDLIAFGDNLVNAMMEDEDSNIMSGDILKAYGSDKVMKIGAVPLDYTVLPVFDMEVLTQINNATVLGLHNCTVSETQTGPSSPTFNTMDIYQYENNLWYQPTFTMDDESGHYFYATGDTWKQFINMPIDMPTAADTMVATRLKAFTSVDWNEDKKTIKSLHIKEAGSEFIMTARIYTLAGNDLSVSEVNYDYGYNTKMDVGMFSTLTDLTNFDSAPLVVTYNYSTEGNQVSAFNIVNDVQNFAIIDSDTLHRMNETAMLSMYTVPQFASARSW